MVETIERTCACGCGCGSFDESIRRAEVNVMEFGIAQGNRGSNVHAEQGRGESRVLLDNSKSVVEKFGTDRSVLGPVAVDDYGADGRLNVAEEYSKNRRSADVEQGRESWSCVARPRQSQSDEEHSMNSSSRSLDIEIEIELELKL